MAEETLGDKIGQTEEPPQEDFNVKLTQIRDEFTGQFGALKSAVDTLIGTVAGIRQSTPAPTPARLEQEMSDEELSNGMLEGKPAAIRSVIRSELSRFEREKLAPMREAGVASISQISQTIASKDLKYYKRYEKEINQYLSTVNPELRMQPQMIQLAYKAVLGDHIDEIENEVREQTIRSRAADNSQDTAGATRAIRKQGTMPTAQEEFGDSAHAALKQVGRDEDHMARRMGYASWADYREKTKKYGDWNEQ